MGIEVRALSSKEAQKYGLDNQQGIFLTRVDPKGPMGKAGFEAGDIILGMENQPVESLDSFIELAGSLKPKQSITLLAIYHRSGDMGNIQVNVR